MNAVMEIMLSSVAQLSQPQYGAAQRMLYTESGIVAVEGPVSAERIRQFSMCEGLGKFRRPKEQHLALMDIANLPEGLVYIAHQSDTIVGYITFHYPEFERWAQSGMLCLLELGAIEVSRSWRGSKIAAALVQIPFDTAVMNDKIIISLECYWFWDLQGSNLTVYEYRKLMERLMGKAGFETKLTDDPDICSHPANLLSVRVGQQVTEKDRQKFESVCYQSKLLL
ncbi:MAG: GNAT family N-acetyltransferase [Dethiobacter sp.]|nr:GNAT family N-acetyltransferase [Dethiobacter sp.]MBS3902355.1 GNAT family N-acetyltransferase [Dethiobacter sp.]